MKDRGIVNDVLDLEDHMVEKSASILIDEDSPAGDDQASASALDAPKLSLRRVE